jgi:two-component system, OmpR family, sensor histidine kinase ChvG
LALETERAPATFGPWDNLKSWTARMAQRVSRAAADPKYAAQKLKQLWLFRFISANLLRRILLANLAGLLLMVGGILYLSQYHKWLVDAKQESLRTQGEIIAAAIASDARVEQGNIEIDLSNKPSDAQPNRAPYRDDAFAALQLSIKPERVTPVMRRLIQPTRNRARIYGRDGTLIVDSISLLTRGQLSNPPAAPEKTKTKNFWTRLTAILSDQHLPVYREIGNAKGTSYPEVRRALEGFTTPMLLLNEEGEQIVSMAVPIKRANTILGVLLMSTRPGDIDKILNEDQSHILTLAAVALLATIISSLLLARTVAGPIRKLSDAAEHVSHNITARQELPDYADRNDEVGQLSRAFKAMTAALFRRIEASESFAADVAHELKNPLAAARSTADSLVYAKSDAQRDELVRQIQGELKRLNRLITDVSNASRLEAELARQKIEPINVTGVVESVARIFHDILGEDDRTVAVRIEPSALAAAFVVNGEEGRLGQVVTNLIDNAVSFSPPSGKVTVGVRQLAKHVEISVEDQGPGIPEDRLAIIFDRFYTDRPQSETLRGKNSGLGLSISREIVRSHSGEIWAENLRSPGAAPDAEPIGARFVVRLPWMPAVIRGGPSGGWRS